MNGIGWAIVIGCVAATAVIGLYGTYKNSAAFRQGYRDYLECNYTSPHKEDSPEHQDWMEGQIAAFIESSPYR